MSMLPHMVQETSQMVKVLKWGHYAELFSWAQCNHKVFYKRERVSESKREVERWETRGESLEIMVYCWI